MVRVSVAVQVLAVVVLGPFMVMVKIKNRETSYLNMQGGSVAVSGYDDDDDDALVWKLVLLQVDGGEAERRLLNTLMEQYNKLERPVYNESQAVQLKFGLTLQQIMDVVSLGGIIKNIIKNWKGPTRNIIPIKLKPFLIIHSVPEKRRYFKLRARGQSTNNLGHFLS